MGSIHWYCERCGWWIVRLAEWACIPSKEGISAWAREEPHASKSIPHPNTTFQDLQFWFKIAHSRDTINCSLPEKFHDHFAFPISDEYCTRRSAPDSRPCEIYTLQRVERCTIVRLFPVPNLMTQWKLMMVDFFWFDIPITKTRLLGNLMQ